eukprot:TRINITY_DN9700_c0_g1_i2.p1 TRINITY_DN9700_c0_g1~~TRINITY_DN9700_c0_g1_i2.p1  ORF type:complete len:199 (-),score=48.39 TRINITY_DN9700_c0_g1_i2:13-609(-)
MDVVTYLSTPNLVNTMGTHVGTYHFRLSPLIQEQKLGIWGRTVGSMKSMAKKAIVTPISNQIFGNATFPSFLSGVAAETMTSHGMLGIKLSMQRAKPEPHLHFDRVVKWPLGPLACIKFYQFCQKYNRSDFSPEDDEFCEVRARDLRTIGYSLGSMVLRAQKVAEETASKAVEIVEDAISNGVDAVTHAIQGQDPELD